MNIIQFKKIIILSLFSIAIMLRGNVSYPEDNHFSVVEIFKYDRSVQCEKNSGISISVMKGELERKGIKAYASRASHDNMSYIAMCGEATGKINIYEINVRDLENALAIGYMIYSNDGR